MVNVYGRDPGEPDVEWSLEVVGGDRRFVVVGNTIRWSIDREEAPQRVRLSGDIRVHPEKADVDVEPGYHREDGRCEVVVEAAVESLTTRKTYEVVPGGFRAVAITLPVVTDPDDTNAAGLPLMDARDVYRDHFENTPPPEWAGASDPIEEELERATS
jgi:hypothetical protein